MDSFANEKNGNNKPCIFITSAPGRNNKRIGHYVILWDVVWGGTAASSYVWVTDPLDGNKDSFSSYSGIFKYRTVQEVVEANIMQVYNFLYFDWSYQFKGGDRFYHLFSFVFLSSYIFIMKKMTWIFLFLSLFIFSGCSLNENKQTEPQISEARLVLDNETPALVQTWTINKREQHLELLSGYFYWENSNLNISTGRQEFIDTSLVLEEVPFAEKEESTHKDLWALNTKQIMKVSWFDKLFSWDITQKMADSESMFSCQLKKEDFIEWVWYGEPCMWVRYFIDKFSFVFTVGDKYPELNVRNWKRELAQPWKKATFEFSRYKLPEDISFEEFITTYNRPQEWLCLRNGSVSRIFAYWEDNPEYVVYRGDANSWYYFNQKDERILYTGKWHQWSDFFWYSINHLLANNKAQAYILNPVLDVPNLMRTCNGIDIGVIFHINGDEYFYIAKSLTNESLSLSDADGVSNFFIDSEK